MLRMPARMRRIVRCTEGQLYVHKVTSLWNDVRTLLGAKTRIGLICAAIRRMRIPFG